MPGNVRPVADERDGLLAYLAQQRSVLKITAYGLTDEQARQAPTVSTLSVGGLLKHVAQVEHSWMCDVLQQPSGIDPEAYGHGFTLLPDETLAGVIATYDATA